MLPGSGSTYRINMNDKVLIHHGSGGLLMRNLIHDIFLRYFDNGILKSMTDSAILVGKSGHFAFTTDSYVVDPLFFPGGNIGKLAVCGTVNDLAVSGAVPLYLSVSFIIEEGFSISDLEVIVRSMADEARMAGVKIVTGDTKVVEKGKADKLFINTSGVGLIPKGLRLSSACWMNWAFPARKPVLRRRDKMALGYASPIAARAARG